MASTRDSVVHTQMMAHTRRGRNCFDAVMGISLSNRATMFPRAGFLRVVHILGRSQRHVKSRLGSGRRSLMRDSSLHGSHPHRQTNEEFARKVKTEFYSFQIDLSRDSIVFFGTHLIRLLSIHFSSQSGFWLARGTSLLEIDLDDFALLILI